LYLREQAGNVFRVPLNDPITSPVPSRQPGKRLRWIGVMVLLLGLASAGTVYWRGTHTGEPTEDELMPGNARAETHQMGLKQPGTQAAIIAGGSILIGAACFYFARLSDVDDAS
jgi:hypothetical protein